MTDGPAYQLITTNNRGEIDTGPESCLDIHTTVHVHVPTIYLDSLREFLQWQAREDFAADFRSGDARLASKP